MFGLTSTERKVLLFIGILILVGSLIRFFKVNSRVSDPYQVNPAPARGGANAPAIININKASSQDLQKIPGIGEEISRRIIDYRTQYGEFKTLDDLKKVKGIGEKKAQSLKSYITF